MNRNWNTYKIKEIGTVITGSTPSTKVSEYYNGSYKLISPVDLDNGKYVKTSHKTLTEAGLQTCRILPKNSVLVGCIGNIGKIGLTVDDKSATNQQINSIICNDDHDPDFIYYLILNNKNLLEQRADKTTLPILNKTNFENIELTIPSLPEQQKIADVLSTLQRAIELQNELIERTTELKKSMMHKLFTEGIRGEKQKETEIGLVPESWEVVEICELLDDTNLVNMKAECNNTIRYIDVSSIIREQLSIGDTEEFILRDAPDRARKKVYEGDVIFATVRPTLLRVAYIDLYYHNQVCSTAFCVLRAKHENSRKYIYFLVQRNEFIKQLASIQSGASYPAVTDRQVKSRLIPLPGIDEQRKIGEVLNSINQKILNHTIKKQRLEELFRTLLHQLMTAQVRVDEIEIVF